MSISIGELRRRLTIERADDTPDGAGGSSRMWTPIGDVFARVEARRRRESVDDGRQVGVVTHRISIRWRNDVNGNTRFVGDDVVYRVLSVEDTDIERRFQDCWCEEEQA